MSAVAPADIASVAATQEDDTGGRMKEMDGLLVNTITGEIVDSRQEQDDYEAYQQEAMRAMREEEKNILAHRHPDEREPGDGSELGDNW